MNNVAELNACNPNSPRTSILCVTSKAIGSFVLDLVAEKVAKNPCTISGTTFLHNTGTIRGTVFLHKIAARLAVVFLRHTSARFCLIL